MARCTARAVPRARLRGCGKRSASGPALEAGVVGDRACRRTALSRQQVRGQGLLRCVAWTCSRPSRLAVDPADGGGTHGLPRALLKASPLPASRSSAPLARSREFPTGRTRRSRPPPLSGRGARCQVALVGAPNVGKSSLVQALSSGLPEVCEYPFTTRNIKMGHFYVDGRRHQARTVNDRVRVRAGPLQQWTLVKANAHMTRDTWTGSALAIMCTITVKPASGVASQLPGGGAQPSMRGGPADRGGRRSRAGDGHAGAAGAAGRRPQRDGAPDPGLPGAPADARAVRARPHRRVRNQRGARPRPPQATAPLSVLLTCGCSREIRKTASRGFSPGFRSAPAQLH